MSASAGRSLAILSASIVASLIVGTPAASSDSGTDYVATQSGRVRCLLSANGAGTNLGRPVVICETSASGNRGFLQAPLTSYGEHLHNAVVDDSGTFRFSDGGNIGGAGMGGDIVLSYGRSYRLRGWTVEALETGTRFTNDRTGHGMFVSVEDAYGF